MAALLWAITNFVDKYLISKLVKNSDYRGLTIMSALVAGLTLLPLSLILAGGDVAVDGIQPILLIFLAAGFYVAAVPFYFMALSKNDTSLVIAMFNLIPVFGYFFGLIFLDEHLTGTQIIGCLIVLVASVALSFEFDSKKFSKQKLAALVLMGAASLCYAVYFLLFRLTTLENDFYKMTFWYQIGLALVGLLIFLLARRWRKSFVELVKLNGKKALALNVGNEAINLVANFAVNFAITLAPMAIVETLNGTQPIFAFLIGLVLMAVRPKIFKEDTRRHIIIQKVVCIMISVFGLAILYM